MYFPTEDQQSVLYVTMKVWTITDYAAAYLKCHNDIL